MSLGNRIKESRENKNLNQSQLAKLVGITQQSLQAIENDEIKQPRQIVKIAEALGVSPEWLQFGVDNKFRYVDWKMEKPFTAGSRVGQPLTVIDHISIPSNRNSSQFALTVKGDSMVSPNIGMISFLPGDVIVADPELTAQNGNYVIAFQEGMSEVLFKQYVAEGKRKYLRSLNPAYGSIDFDETVTIWGVVIMRTNILI